MMPAAVTMPGQPYWPGPVWAGMNGSQLAPCTYQAPKAMNSTITATLIATTMPLKRADCWMPT